MTDLAPLITELEEVERRLVAHVEMHGFDPHSGIAAPIERLRLFCQRELDPATETTLLAHLTRERSELLRSLHRINHGVETATEMAALDQAERRADSVSALDLRGEPAATAPTRLEALHRLLGASLPEDWAAAGNRLQETLFRSVLGPGWLAALPHFLVFGPARLPLTLIHWRLMAEAAGADPLMVGHDRDELRVKDGRRFVSLLERQGILPRGRIRLYASPPTRKFQILSRSADIPAALLIGFDNADRLAAARTLRRQKIKALGAVQAEGRVQILYPPLDETAMARHYRLVARSAPRHARPRETVPVFRPDPGTRIWTSTLIFRPR